MTKVAHLSHSSVSKAIGYPTPRMTLSVGDKQFSQGLGITRYLLVNLLIIFEVVLVLGVFQVNHKIFNL